MRAWAMLPMALSWLPFAAAAEQPARPLWSGSHLTLQGGPSKDGRYFSYADRASGALMVRNVASGEDRVVRTPTGPRELAYFSTISPDSSRIAYAWRNNEDYYEIRVVNLDGTGERVLFKNEEIRFVQPCAWTPDGKHILTLFFRTDNISQIVLLPVAGGGAPKILRSLQWVYPKRMDVSPDGRYIVYDSFAPGPGSARTLYSLPLDGSSEHRLVTTPGDHLFPLWDATGKNVIYVREESGEMNLWMLRVEEGKPVGEPRLVRGNLGRALPLGITANGDYYHGVRNDRTDIQLGDGQRLSTRFPGRNHGPAWQPGGGGSLAYLSRRGAENFGASSSAVVIRSADGTEREVAVSLPVMERVRWAPGGDALLVSGMDGKGRAGLFYVDLAHGDAMRPIAAEAGLASKGFPGVFSRDGKTVYYISNETEVRARGLAADSEERTLATGSKLRHLAIQADGGTLAFTQGDAAIVLQPLGVGPARTIPFDHPSELEWGQPGLWVGRGEELWRVPVDGSAPVRVTAAPRGRVPGFSLGPRGSLAVTVGTQDTQVWRLRLGGGGKP